MLEVKNLHVSIGGRKILNGLSTYVVNDGEIAAIMGPNGSGKVHAVLRRLRPRRV